MKESAYGIIPIYRSELGLEIFLIHQYGSGGDMLWSFPKGHGEEGETPLETAMRECLEESGLIPDEVEEGYPFSISYSFERKGIRVEKTSTYFVGFVSHRDFKIQEDEVKEAGWFPLEDVRDQLTFEYSKKLFDSVRKHLDK